MPYLRISENIGHISGGLELLVGAVGPFSFFTSWKLRKTRLASSKAAIPSAPMYFSILSLRQGVKEISSSHRNQTHLANKSVLDFPVSRTDDNRLVANTSGSTSVKI